jgi:hypothetical protein
MERMIIFLGSAWLNGMLPKDIALKIYEIASEKKCTVKKALDNELLVSHINTQNGLSVEQILHNSTSFGRYSKVSTFIMTHCIRLHGSLEKKSGIYSAYSA